MHKHIKRWGQVFLKNKKIQKDIGNYVNSLNYLNLVEIGPGEGSLTDYVDKKNKKFYAIELDKKLAAFLKQKYSDIHIIQGDILKVNTDFLNGQDSLIFGNIPYYITSSIIFKFLKERHFRDAVFMIQKECFESIISPSKTKKYSSFSALLQTFTEVKKVLDVGRNNFFPIPAVDSVVIHFKKINSSLESKVDGYAIFLKKCFFMPRKTLRNNFRKFLDSQAIDEIFFENQIEENIRPDEISCNKYESIFLSKSGKQHLHNLF